MLIFGLMLILIKTAACVDRNCRLSQSDLCYAALGHKLNLEVDLDISKHELTLTKTTSRNTQVCRVKIGEKRGCDFLQYRLQVTYRRLIINYVTREDSGSYTLSFYNSSRTQILTGGLQVNVEAPIGSVEVSIICSSNGVMTVNCSSDGDPMSYSWTLNGETLMKRNSSIEFTEETEGYIDCSVKNNISHREKTIRLVCPTGVDRVCRFNQSDPCNATVGDKLILQMLPDARGVHLDLHKGQGDSRMRVLKLINSKETFHESIRNTCKFIHHNWTLIINSVITADSGDYRLEIYDSHGTITSEQHLQVYIRDLLVSSVSSVWFEVCVLLWCFQMMVLLGLLGGFHIYMRHTAEMKQDDQNLRMRRFEEGHEDA